MLYLNDHYQGAMHKSDNREVTAIDEALEWIHQQPTDSAISFDIYSDKKNSYFGINAVNVMPGRDSCRICRGRLI